MWGTNCKSEIEIRLSEIRAAGQSGSASMMLTCGIVGLQQPDADRSGVYHTGERSLHASSPGSRMTSVGSDWLPLSGPSQRTAAYIFSKSDIRNLANAAALSQGGVLSTHVCAVLFARVTYAFQPQIPDNDLRLMTKAELASPYLTTGSQQRAIT